jgi:hypothetical protein
MNSPEEGVPEKEDQSAIPDEVDAEIFVRADELFAAFIQFESVQCIGTYRICHIELHNVFNGNRRPNMQFISQSHSPLIMFEAIFR